MSLPEGSVLSSSTAGGDLDFGQEVTLADKLKVFKSSGFDPENYVSTKCRTTSEKEIRNLVTCLLDLKKASAEEMRKSVYANYPSFIRTSREISDLEGQLVTLRNLLSNRATIIHTLAEGVGVVDSSAMSSSSSPGNSSKKGSSFEIQDRKASKMEVWLSEYMENLNILLAERRVDEALGALDEGEGVAKQEDKSMTRSMLCSLQDTITAQRQKLADQIADSACQPSSSGIELRSFVEIIKQLGDGPRAHTLLLNSHQHKLQSKIQGLQTSGSNYGVAYTAALSQLVFSIIAQASSDSLAIFGDQPLYTSELVTWSVKQTNTFAHLMKRHVIASPSASGGLRTVAECVQISMGHCYLLEARGLALGPVLLRHFRPCVEQALNANLKRIEQSTAAVAAGDDWSLCFGTSHSTGTSSILSQPKLSSSAHRFNVMVQEMCEDIGLLRSLQFSNQAMEGVVQVFNSYVHMLVNALPGSSETENLEGRIVRTAVDETQQIGLLANALLLADELLPRAAIKLLPLQQCFAETTTTPRRQLRTPHQRELKKRLQRFVDQLRDSFCRKHALDLIFTDDGTARLNSQIYFTMDDNSQHEEWFPSLVYQELFVKLCTVASLASDMFVGRERFTTLLLIRLTETVILWLSDEQSFWEEIEHGPKTLGPFGLRQFYLDMQFVILFASQGRYLSRNLHQVIKNIISRVMDSVATANTDPYSMLPDDEWFTNTGEVAIKMLTGKSTFENVEEATSPTASVSVVSQGSN